MNTKGKYGKVTDTEMKQSIISKSVMIIIYVVFIDQFIDYLINSASLTLEGPHDLKSRVLTTQPPRHFIWSYVFHILTLSWF